jgi:hypothetical protein
MNYCVEFAQRIKFLNSNILKLLTIRSNLLLINQAISR